MNLRTVALAAAAGALLTAGATTAQAAEPERSQAVGLVKKDALTPWSVVDFALGTEQERSATH
ncbi:hypothetical protein [Streptomyces sp. SP18CS02]|uniref:hypothetical protein n=1 Tax=Streptomyces sp. SP18CS02 TaxID=3002531 RepID=UPI002E793D88|nr:hypothetical protein [Streptomyces sp. SP18CS02]MEE1757470.1 hypothetical protein [Streptomyces sp. SP18CS02]